MCITISPYYRVITARFSSVFFGRKTDIWVVLIIVGASPTMVIYFDISSQVKHYDDSSMNMFPILMRKETCKISLGFVFIILS